MGNQEVCRFEPYQAVAKQEKQTKLVLEVRTTAGVTDIKYYLSMTEALELIETSMGALVQWSKKLIQ